jgi:hypothetical protein
MNGYIKKACEEETKDLFGENEIWDKKGAKIDG